MGWKDKTCEKCVFQVAGECRRFPPPCDTYSAVRFGTMFSPACAEYAESLDDTSEFVQLSE